MQQEKIRNIAIIAHVDHGKTTLVDTLFEQAGAYEEREEHTERLMDSGDIEKERGITITAKNGAFEYEGHWVNIIDTPGHADFGGQVERVLRMADGALLVVDAQEGPMPQTFFVLKKALALGIPVGVVVNKIDKPAARPEWVVDQVFDLFVKLNAPDDMLDFPVTYASAKEGYAMNEPDEEGKDMRPILDMVIRDIPAPTGDTEAPLQMLISSLDYAPFLGRLAIGKITQGSLKINKEIAIIDRDGTQRSSKVTKIYRFVKNDKVSVDEAFCGEIVAVAGMDNITVGVTYTDLENPQPLPPMEIDPPTISMNFVPNDSPFAGREGEFLTNRHIGDRLAKEVLSDVALSYEVLQDRVGFSVSGRGELHLSILIETMRREGFELQATRPQVIYRTVDGKKHEPYEEVTIDVDEEFSGAVIEKLGQRKGQMTEMIQMEGGLTRIVYIIPTRGLLGYKSQFMTDTRGMGMMSYIFHGYDEYAGEIINRKNGAMYCKVNCTAMAFALGNLQDRGKLFIPAAIDLYEGQIVGEHSRSNDLVVNPGKGKKLSNMRSSGADDAVVLVPHKEMDLEDCIAWINDDELVEITPAAIRLSKMNAKRR